MPSPDIQPYVGLELFDQDPQDIFDICVGEMRLAFPDWEPREGNVEVQLLDAISVAFAEVIFAINRLPDGIFEALLKFFGLTRDIGERPTVFLQFELGDELGSIIPAGTAVTLPLANEQGEVDFNTIEDLEILDGESIGVVEAQSSQYTAEANGIPANTLATIIDSLPSVDYVRTTTVVTDGRDPEDDSDYFSRGTQLLQRLTAALVLPYHFENYALEQPYVERAFGIDNYDPAGDPDNNGPTGANPGHMTVAVYGENELVSAPNKALLLDAMENTSYANLIVHLIDPVITTFNVNATIQANPSYDSAAVVANISIALRQFYNPMSWNWGSKVRLNELIALISNVEGVDFVQTMTTPNADINLTSVANLVTIGTINITVI